MKAISAENLPSISHDKTPVITTELLAKLYGTEALNIQVNHTRNKDRFVEGKHYFKTVGDELKNLRLTLSKSQSEVQISQKTRALILWTERGAARHAKMLETDQAWEVFEKLEDSYFNKKNEQVERPSQVPAFIPVPMDRDGEWVVQVSGNCVTCVRQVMQGEMVISVPSYQEMMERAGNIIMPYHVLGNLTSTEIVGLVAEAERAHLNWRVIYGEPVLGQ